jgi:hypothetical protein
MQVRRLARYARRGPAAAIFVCNGASDQARAMRGDAIEYTKAAS